MARSYRERLAAGEAVPLPTTFASAAVKEAICYAGGEDLAVRATVVPGMVTAHVVVRIPWRTVEAALAARQERKRRKEKNACPCCSRSFQNLQRHMATKHPQWKEPAE